MNTQNYYRLVRWPLHGEHELIQCCPMSPLIMLKLLFFQKATAVRRTEGAYAQNELNWILGQMPPFQFFLKGVCNKEGHIIRSIQCQRGAWSSILQLSVPAVMTVNIPQAVSTYTVMYMSWNIVMEWASVSPTIVGLEWTCVYACWQPLNINPAEQIPLKTNFGTCSPQTRCWYSSDYSIVQECKCLCQRGCWLWDTVYELYYTNVIITCPLYYTPTGQDSLVKVYNVC